MKNLVFVILIVFAPALFMGCEKGGNIVEKLAPEPTEGKYDPEIYAEIQEIIPNYKKLIKEVKRSRKMYSSTKRKVFMQLDKYIDEELTPDDYAYVASIIRGGKKLHDAIREHKSWGKGVREAHSLTHARFSNLTGLSETEKREWKETINRMLIAVYLFDVRAEEVQQSIKIGGLYSAAFERRELEKLGLF